MNKDYLIVSEGSEPKASDYVLRLTLAVYRVTDLFPEKEPLKFKIREKAVDILTSFLSNNPHPSTENLIINIEIIKNFFNLAKFQDFVDFRNFLVLEREYDKIKEQIERFTLREKREPKRRKSANLNCDLRRKKILEVLREKGRAQIWELKEIFPEVTKRTLRRDIVQLLKEGLIQRRGRKNKIYYQVS